MTDGTGVHNIVPKCVHKDKKTQIIVKMYQDLKIINVLKKLFNCL